jgi:hypothetical protein
MSTHHSHVFDSYIAELGLTARSRRRAERAERAAAADVEGAVTLAVSAWPAATDAPRTHNWTEPRVVNRARGDRPARFAGVRAADAVQPCLGLS